MSRRLSREGDPGQTSAQIVQGGCYGHSPWDVPQFNINDTAGPVVTNFYEWGPWVNGGAWLTIAGQRVDFLLSQLRTRIQTSQS